MGLFSSIQSSRHSGNSVLCPRSVPSMKRFIRSPAAAKNQRCENHMKQDVFTQPGSVADITRLLSNVRFTPESGQIADIPACPLCAKKRTLPQCQTGLDNG